MSLTQSTRSAAGVNGALDTFWKAVRSTDAYPDLLTNLGFDPDSVRTSADFLHIPPMTKKNYLAMYSLPQLIPGGDVASACLWSSSSGSSGTPTNWPRAELSLQQSVDLHERILRQHEADRRSTLVVVCFAMGNWIGGIYTMRAVEELRKQGFPVSVVTPGVHVDTVRENIGSLGCHYEQVLIAGYPPFVRDVLDGAGQHVLSQDLKFLLAGESISEAWRDGILALVGKSDRPEDICLVYGTADAGMIGHETPTTIAVRRLAVGDAELDASIFGGTAASATLVEYDASMRFVETDDEGFLLFTVDNTIPLIRYRMNDIGEVLSADEMRRRLFDAGHTVDVAASTAHSGFIVLKRRADIAVSFYAVNIYPEPVRTALSDPRLSNTVTGKFVMTTTAQKDLRGALSLHVELRPGVGSAERADAACADLIKTAVVDALVAASSEFEELHGLLGTLVEPEITFGTFASDGFEVDVKLRHIQKVSGQ
ncbi:phenylacetate--CoA ligase family protein [Rhodococcus sp. 1168]|uniref:phenylacetate--CoA ligase family protein n=1 Tax=Rhodococcus sp. 1168 TaxID=2018041 RepID=UPI000F74579F|nr:phenylacetate--CoA ligase family protein [Rhodococcus sp. 1168]